MGRRAAFVVGAVALLITAAPAPAQDLGHFSDTLQTDFNVGPADAQRAVDTSWMLSDVQMYGFGDDPTRPPTLSPDDVPYGVPLNIGLDTINWGDAALVPPVPANPQIIGDDLWIPGPGGPPEAHRNYVTVHAVMGGDIPLACDRNINFGFPFSVEGQDGWVSTFRGDTWQGASLVPFVTCDPTAGWDFQVAQVVPGNRIELRNDLTGFAYAGRDTLIVGFDRDPVFFGPVDQRIGYGWAGDVGDQIFGPESIRLVTAWPGQPMEGPFPAAQPEPPILPGFDGRFHIVDIWPIVGPDNTIWLGLQPAAPWPGTPPMEYFSQFVQWGVQYVEQPENGAFFGWQIFDGQEEMFASGPTGPLAFELYTMDNGSLVGQTHLTYTEGDDLTLQVTTEGGYLATDGGQFLGTGPVPFTFGPGDIVMDDPLAHDGGFPVYDFVTGQPVEPPPTTTTTVTETTEPVVRETTTTQPAVTAETTTTTQPAVTTTDDDTTTTVIRTVEVEPCWWCWGLIALFVLFLICMIYIWFKSYEWWTCWLPWFLVIFIWVPFLLVGMWFWQPWWWWLPLLGWFPLIGGYAWWWAQKRSWWRPWYWYPLFGYGIGLALILVLWSPQWYALLPFFWAPWVVFYVWYRGRLQPWWQPWMWLACAGYGFWIFAWAAWLTPWWAWWFPIVFFPFAGWWIVSHRYDWGIEYLGKWCWIVGFSFIPFLAWWIPFWGPWWCFVIIAAFTITLLCAVFFHLWEEEWWTCWLPWFLGIFIWVPFLLAGLWFFRPNWWWLPLLGWFPLIGGYAWWWGRRQPWWRPWYWYLLGVYGILLAGGMVVVGAPEWGLLLPLFWVPWVAFYVWYRGRLQPWWQPWMWLLFGGYTFWVFAWLGWLTPWWGWWFPVAFFPIAGWWILSHGYDWDVEFGRKWCWIVPFSLLPWLGYMLAVYCIPEYYGRVL